jgi:valyl-tRNA synthetase
VKKGSQFNGRNRNAFDIELLLFKRLHPALNKLKRVNESMETLKPKLKEKRWQPKIEEEIIKSWEEGDIYKFNEGSSKPIFSIDTPPPYASGKWHVGAAAHYAQIDMVARYFRMKGFEVLFPFGVDRNGLPVEVEVEKTYNISAHKVPREKFIDLCKGFLDRVEKDLIWIARRMGMSCDLKNYYRTDSPEYRRITQASFIDLWNRGLIYEDDRPTNWCPVCRTTIADAEIEYEEELTDLCDIKFKVKEDGGYITISTTRPELLCSCAAVIFNPSDERYQHLEGKTAIVPIFEREVPITAHSYAKPEFGTGLVMICSFGDYSDIRLFRELNLKPRIAIDKDGRMTEAAGVYSGMTIAEARKKTIEDLEKRGLLSKKEKIIHKVPVCWRSKNPIEFISMPEYYQKQLDYLDDLKAIVEMIKFYPPESKQLLLNWINSIALDYPISRRRYYGTEIPIWYCKKCGKAHLPKPGKYYQPWREKAPFKKCDCGSTEFKGEERTFDTWMDSSLTQLVIIGYLTNESLLKKAFPCSLRPQGADIVRTWLYYSILKTYLLLSKPAFSYVRISGMGLDEKGEAMHKSKGNVILPEPLFKTYGADAFRLWSASEAKLGSNYRYSEDRVKGASKFLTKLWNIARFVSLFPVVNEEYELENLDKMILSELNDLIENCVRECDNMDFFTPALAIRNFAWNMFADHYIEAVKARAYNTGGKFNERLQRGAWYTLHTCLQTIIKLLAPICPFITEAIWKGIYSNESVHMQKYPEKKIEWESRLKNLMKTFIDFNSIMWKFKKERGMALNEKISIVYARKELEPLANDLKEMHKIEKLCFGEPAEEEKKKAVKIDEIYIIA